MKHLICKDYDEMSRVGAMVVARQIWSKPESVLGFATGGTPVGLYRVLVGMFKSGVLDFSRVTTFNLDEYYPMSKEDKQSYHMFMWDNLLSSVNVSPQNVNIPDGGAPDPKGFCEAYEEKLRSAGGVDLQILGIGRNGHIAFNEPASELPVKTGVVSLSESTIDANARFFGDRGLVPKQALSMGIGTILAARSLLLLISGADKAPVAGKLFSGTVTTQIPATLLQLHPDALVLMDRAAAGML